MVYTLESALGAPPLEYLMIHKTPLRFFKMALKRRLVADQVEHNLKISGGTEMKRQLSWLSFACMGVGVIIATGVFSFMPIVYSSITGPAIIISLIIASVVAATSALVYSEFAVEYPVVGGGFVYVLNVFGEYPAVLCAVNLVIDYVFGTAAVVRNLSIYFSQLVNCNFHTFQVRVGFQHERIDWLAFLICVFLTLVACWSTKVFDDGNIFLQGFHVFLVFFTFIAAFTKAERKNWKPFFPSSLDPSGPRTVVTGASNIFFVFTGYDIIALGAEEAKTSYSVPVGMIACVIFVAIVYLLMAAALVMLLPFNVLANQPPENALSGFAYAFTQRGMVWAKYIVAAGACIGIFTSTGMGIYGLSRIFQVFAREGMVPAFVGQVNSFTSTPIIAIITSGLVTGCIALFTGFSTLVSMTSIGTLTMYWFVAVAYIYRRYAPEFTEDEDAGGDRHLALPFRPDPFGSLLGVAAKRALLLFYIFIITMAAVGYVIYWNLSDGYAWLIVTACVWFLSTLTLQLTMPICYVPAKFGISWWALPWVPSVSIFANIMLIGGFGAHKTDYIRLFVAMGIGTGVYLLFGVHSSYYRFYGPKRNEDSDTESFDNSEYKKGEGNYGDVNYKV